MKNHTTNYIMAAFFSLSYYLGFRENLLFFQILSWVAIVVTFLMMLFSYGLLMTQKEFIEKNAHLFQFNKSFLFFSTLFTILNIWITWGTQFCYVYAFISVMSFALIELIKSKKY